MRSGQVQYEEDLKPLMVPIDSLIQHPDNFNNGDVDAIIASIEANGMYRPVFAARDTREIIAGNHTWMACKSLNAEVIPVIWLDGDYQAGVKRMIADNRTAALARPDDTQLLALLAELEVENALLGTGYEERDVEALRALAEMPVDLDTDFAQWPTLCFQVPPHVKRGFYEMTDAAVGDRERFELVLRLAGWDGKA
jgi:ParB-like chromosome segregation protein Spo0J